jgi:hypothetical protein
MQNRPMAHIINELPYKHQIHLKGYEKPALGDLGAKTHVLPIRAEQRGQLMVVAISYEGYARSSMIANRSN